MSDSSKETTLPLQVHDVGFLLDRLGEDCHPLQFLRELTQNAIEAIQKTDDGKGQIVWDVDWLTYEMQPGSPFKLCITDNGCGMNGDEMGQYINQLSSSGGIQSHDANYGVGAKIAAATRNHNGLIYLSWKDGDSAMIHLWRNPETKQYGLRQFEKPDGTFGHWAEVDDSARPEIIADHGTKIILNGNFPEQDTMQAPPEAASPSTWISKYLNSRYFRIPDGITIKARQGWKEPRNNKDSNILRTITGQHAYLEQHKESSGSVDITDARVHWWILKDEKAIGSNSGFIESSGHVAALYQDELYESLTGRAGQSRLQQFGIVFGHKFVVLYVEPLPGADDRLSTNTARTQLLLNSEHLRWTEWAAEFREVIPTEIKALMDRIASKSSEADHSKSIRDRLKAMLDLFRISRYKPSTNGDLLIGDPASAGGSSKPHQVSPRNKQGSGSGAAGSNNSGGAVGGVYSAFLKKNGDPGAAVQPDMFPKVTWVSLTNGTREPGEMEDKAAKYLKEQHMLKINADFRVFSDMTKHWVDTYASKHGALPGLQKTVRDSVHGWYEQSLTETVIGLQALRGSKEWPDNLLDDAWSEASLTAVVMQRYHAFNAVKRDLGTKLRSLKI